jgi:hypothetical protein
VAWAHYLDWPEAETFFGSTAQGFTESLRSISFSVNRTEIM